MARNDERYRIPGQRVSNRLGFGGLPDGPGYLAIGLGLSSRNFSNNLVHLARERVRATQVDGNGPKILNFTLEVFLYFLDDFGNLRRRCTRSACP